MRETIPLTRSLALDGLRYDGTELILTLPLAPNVNDKGCAFGGSIACLATLTGWGLLRLALGENQQPADMYIQDQQTKYVAPAWQQMVARCSWSQAQKSEFLNNFARRAKARASVSISCTSDDIEVCTMDARFVALKPGTGKAG